MERHLRVDQCCVEPKHNKRKSIFIGNLSYEVDEETLWKLFSSCGSVENVRIVRDRHTGRGKGFGYVQFETADQARQARTLNGTMVGSRPLRILKNNGKLGRRRQS